MGLMTPIGKGQRGGRLSAAPSTCGVRHQPDLLVSAVPTRAHRAVVTLNRRHFVRLHQDRPWHTDSIVCTFDLDFAALVPWIHQVIADSSTLAGQLVRVNRPS